MGFLHPFVCQEKILTHYWEVKAVILSEKYTVYGYINVYGYAFCKFDIYLAHYNTQ